MSQFLVVDAVLLPPEPVQNLALHLNRLLDARQNAIRLGREWNRPHISLAMIGARQADVSALCRALKKAADRFLPLDLAPAGIERHRGQGGEVTTSLLIQNIPALQAVHETVLAAFSPYAVLPVTGDMVAAAPEEMASPDTVDYINHFLERSAFERYTPHITLGLGELPGEAAAIRMPDRFRVDSARLCRVGNRGVCRELLCADR